MVVIDYWGWEGGTERLLLHPLPPSSCSSFPSSLLLLLLLSLWPSDGKVNVLVIKTTTRGEEGKGGREGERGRRHRKATGMQGGKEGGTEGEREGGREGGTDHGPDKHAAPGEEEREKLAFH